MKKGRISKTEERQISTLIERQKIQQHYVRFPLPEAEWKKQGAEIKVKKFERSVRKGAHEVGC